jgi:hypothetical protein
MLRICQQAMMVHPTEKLQQEGTASGWELKTPERPTANNRQFIMACLCQAFGIWHSRA